MQPSAKRAMEREGFAILREVFNAPEIERLKNALAAIDDHHSVRSRGGVYAIRNLLDRSAAICDLASGAQLRKLAGEHLEAEPFPVRGMLFDKTPGANWLVPWHQDLTICVARKIAVQGFGPWTEKGGVCHVQPPVTVLERILSVRLHLDPCDGDNGALRVLPGTHRLGRLTPERIAIEQSAGLPVSCDAEAGDVVLMKPLLLHASSAATQARQRRVIHIEYADAPLPGGLAWLTSTADRLK